MTIVKRMVVKIMILQFAGTCSLGKKIMKTVQKHWENCGKEVKAKTKLHCMRYFQVCKKCVPWGENLERDGYTKMRIVV